MFGASDAHQLFQQVRSQSLQRCGLDRVAELVRGHLPPVYFESNFDHVSADAETGQIPRQASDVAGVADQSPSGGEGAGGDVFGVLGEVEIIADVPDDSLVTEGAK